MQNKHTRSIPWGRLSLLGLAVLAPTLAFANGRITGVSVSKVGSSVEVLILGTGLSDPKANFAETGKTYTLDFDAKLVMAPDKLQVWKNGLETIHPSGTVDVSQLKFKFTTEVNATISKSIAGYKVVFAPSEKSIAKATTPVKTASAKPIGLIQTIEMVTSKVVAISREIAPIKATSKPKVAVVKVYEPVVASKTTVPGAKLNTRKAEPLSASAAQTFVPLPDGYGDYGKAAITAVPPIHARAIEPITNASAHGFVTPETIAKEIITAKPKETAPKVPVAKVKAEVKDPAPKFTPKAAPKGEDQKVSLDFVNTEIVHIMKAIAMQTRVNIVTSPDVVGKLSVKLDNVTIKEALNLVTALGGLRFANVGKTYVVTTPAKFLETLRSVQGPRDEMTLSRVVPIYSGQGNQIKIAILKSIASENSYGRFEVVLPSEKTVISAVQKVAGAATDEKDNTSMKSESSDSAATDTYLMVIGSPGRIDEVEQLVKSIDRQLCSALGVSIPATNQNVIESYNVHGGRAVDLVDAIAGKGKTTLGSVEIFATPGNSISKQAIVLKGRADEVRAVIRALEQLDSDESATMTEFMVVDLMYADPRSAREMVVASVPGISVVIAPNGVLNPAAYQQDSARTQSEQRGTDQPAPQGGGSPLANGNANQQQANLQQGGAAAGGAAGGQQMSASKEQADSGFVFPFSQFESVGVPMRLIMKGSKEQIERALNLLKVVDIAPKQVALEMRVMEISREELLRLGIDWNLFTSGAVKTIRLNNSQSSPANTIGGSIQGRDLSGDVAASLDSIASSSNLISRPNLLCNDGRGNEVFVGDAIRYIESIISSQNGPSVTTGIVRAGVRLSVFPRIGGDTVNLDLQTSVTYLKGFKAVPQIGGELPQTSERVAGNSITLKDGETFAIGGLIQEQTRREMSGLPILKDLPILGQFFRKSRDEKIKTELVIFVTARLVAPGKDKSKALPMAPDTTFLTPKTGSKPKPGKSGKGGL